jgi:CheY-like chemotaxis protein
LIFMDIRMPHMSGTEALHLLRSNARLPHGADHRLHGARP